MPDEGGPHYKDLIDNMQKGLQFIQETFGRDARPRVAWSIDPFGHFLWLLRRAERLVWIRLFCGWAHRLSGEGGDENDGNHLAAWQRKQRDHDSRA